MTEHPHDPGGHPHADSHGGASADAREVHLPAYVLVFRDEQPPKEYEFTAIGDEPAADWMRKQYPGFEWTLYRVDADQRRHPCYSYPEAGRPPDNPA